MSEQRKITCEICGAEVHVIEAHLKRDHSGVWSLTDYQHRFPNAPLMSAHAQSVYDDAVAKRAAALPVPSTPELAFAHAQMSNVTSIAAVTPAVASKKPMHELFSIDTVKFPEAKSKKGDPINITVYAPPPEHAQFVPDADAGHVWNVEDLKNQLMALEMNIPLYSWGHKGTGKTTDIEQICAMTHRPLMRVQHTINTEESHIIGQMVLDEKGTRFELGPLPMAMLNGHTYLADEYDFALASVLAVYQPVLEGKALFIKEAPAHLRLIKPHANFRFIATGNTNGAGDDTGMYQGTSIQNAANFDRFGMVIQKRYMPAEQESKIVENRSGISPKEAAKLVGFAQKVREQYEAGKISDTLSTRGLVYIAKIGVKQASMRTGINLCFGNKLNRVDRVTIDEVAKRIYS